MFKHFSDLFKINEQILLTGGEKPSLKLDSNTGPLVYCASSLTTELLESDVNTFIDRCLFNTTVNPLIYHNYIINEPNNPSYYFWPLTLKPSLTLTWHKFWSKDWVESAHLVHQAKTWPLGACLSRCLFPSRCTLPYHWALLLRLPVHVRCSPPRPDPLASRRLWVWGW